MEVLHTKEMKRLYQAILRLETEKDCKLFFEDLCTVKEVRDLAQRLEVAYMLHTGKNYQEITASTGASTATISRVKKCLLYGSGGYLNAAKLMAEQGENDEDQ